MWERGTSEQLSLEYFFTTFDVSVDQYDIGRHLGLL